MSKRHTRITFKPYEMEQAQLLPPSLDELIPENHLVRVVHRILEQLNLAPLEAQYRGGGTSSFHPKMMLKVLVYAYTQRIYASRQIAKALRENIHFMWLSGRQQPDFRTLNDFRGRIMKPVIEPVFAAVLEYLIQEGYVRLEHYFVDGTKIEANANKHKVVWRKRNQNQRARLQVKIQQLLAEIEQANAAEQEDYGERDLDETSGSGGELDAAKLEATIAELNAQLAATGETKPQALKQLETDCLPRQQRYEAETETLAGRNSYAKTDPDATCLRMKEDRGEEKPWPKPAYNVQIGTERQFILWFSVHPRAGDTACLIPHLEGFRQTLGRVPAQVIGDAGYGSEENYAFLAAHGMKAFVKYGSFHQDHVRHRKPALREQARFRSDGWPHDAARDVFTCPAGASLTFQYETHRTTENGYPTTRRIYEAGACATCPWKPKCTQAQGNKRMQVSFRLRVFRAQAEARLLSEEGQALRAQRSVEVESVFGQLKHNGGVRRFLLRGQDKVKVECGLHCIAHNLKKVAA